MMKQVGHRFGRNILHGSYVSGQDMAKYMRSDPYGFACSCGKLESMKKKTQESCHILIREQPKPQYISLKALQQEAQVPADPVARQNRGTALLARTAQAEEAHASWVCICDRSA